MVARGLLRRDGLHGQLVHWARGDPVRPERAATYRGLAWHLRTVRGALGRGRARASRHGPVLPGAAGRRGGDAPRGRPVLFRRPSLALASATAFLLSETADLSCTRQ